MRRYSPSLVVLLFGLSGFLGLVYEVLWIRKLTLVFGATTLALATVLAAFFGGMAVGSYVFGRIASRVANGIRLYALLEVGVGAFALAFPALLEGVDRLEAAVFPVLSRHPALLHGGRLLMGLALLAAPTALMGGTLLALVRHFVRAGTGVGTRIGGLYAVNTLGGALGAFTAGYVLIERVGIDSSTFLAGTANLLLGAAAWGLGG
ncbi:MAG: spermidine synthase, partial [Planctomycetes bacterium]|nr:spermidine synthase [Planctomycetota bacterium]